MKTLHGKTASPGSVVGKCLVLKEEHLSFERVHTSNVSAEKGRLESAVIRAKVDLEKLHEQTLKSMGAEKAAIFEAHMMILEDPELLDATKERIEVEKLNAEAAFSDILEDHIRIFKNMDNEYMRERAADLRDIGDRVLRYLTGKVAVDLGALSEPVILVAHDLTPSQTASMKQSMVLGILTNIGGKTSHTAILARTLEIPAVLGLREITTSVATGDWVAFDAEKAEVYIHPTEGIRQKMQEQMKVERHEREVLFALRHLPSVTKSGRKVELAANIGTPKDLESVLRNDAEGVGLYRTEFLYMDRPAWPTEDEQFESYKVVLEKMNPKPVVIRTLDIGGDKKLSYFEMEAEENPFLGRRALRLCLQEVEVFKTQLRALLRASAYGNLKIMFPMVTNLEELKKAKEILNECKQELKSKNVKFADKIEVGIMIEIPAAALMSDILAQHCDFFSIGTNDLIQYTCAVDRMNEKIHDLYDPFHPGVLKLIQMVIENGHKAGIWVGMCGEMAGNIEAIPMLLKMGLDEFSMAPPSILKARKIVREFEG